MDIKKEIVNIILNDEKTEKKRENLIAVKSILLLEKERYEGKRYGLRDIIGSIRMPITDISFYPFGDDIILWLKFSRREVRYGEYTEQLMLQYKNGNISIVNSIGITEEIKKLINVDIDKYRQLGEYALKRNYNDAYLVPTVSNCFKVKVLGDSFVLENNIQTDKKFKLSYNYEKGIPMKDENIFSRDQSFICIDTDIFGLRELFSSKKAIKNNNVDNFLTHLKVDSEKVPQYVKESKYK